MRDFRDLVHDPKHRCRFEKLLHLAAQRGDDDQVAERLSWGIDPNCTSPKGRTALMVNVRSFCPNVATVKALLKAGTDPNHTDIDGMTALDYARRKLMKIQSKPRKTPRKSPSLDENNQLQLSREEQAEMDEFRKQIDPEHRRESMRMWWNERLRAARRTFNDPDQIEMIVQILEAATSKR